MATSSSELHPLVAGEALSVNATFRRKYGIPPKGTPPAGGWADSDYGFPLPPADHPQALKFAHAVLSRAHQATNFNPVDVAKQVRKAKAIVAKHNNSKESATPWRDVRWVDVAKSKGNGFSAVKPRATESLLEFLKRVPTALPANKAAQLSETQLAIHRARAKRARESAVMIGRRGAQSIFEWNRSNVSLREAKVQDDVVKDVLLIREGPGNLADRHWYSLTCLQRAAASGVFEGVQAFLDHPSLFDEQNQPERSVKNLAGWYSDITVKPYNDPELGPTHGLFGDFHPEIGNDKVLSIVRTCVEYAKKYPKKAYAALSINAAGDGEPDVINGESWDRVDEITEAYSVDIVTKAGAGGAIVPLRESFRMSKTATRQNADDIKLTIDADKVKSGITELLESQQKDRRAAVKAMLEKAKGANLTDEEDQELDRKLGVVDGGALDKVLDAATGVDDTVEANREAGKSGDEDDEVEESDDMTEADAADIDKMSHADLKKHAKGLQGKLDAANKATEKARKEAKESARSSAQNSTKLRETMADNVMAELNIPDGYRPRLKHELMREGYTTDKQMREHSQAFDKAFIRPDDSAGVVAGGGNTNGSGKMTFDYADEEN